MQGTPLISDTASATGTPFWDPKDPTCFHVTMSGMPDFRGFLNILGHFCGSFRSNEKIFCPGGGGGGFLVGNGKLCYLLLECFVFLEVETHIYTLFNM